MRSSVPGDPTFPGIPEWRRDQMAKADPKTAEPAQQPREILLGNEV